MLKKIIYRSILFFVMVVCVTACSPYFHQPFGKRDATLGPETAMTKDLLDLPPPKEPIVVAVYKFRDQTGQYKASNVGASWSTAVTQGATNILIRALEESKWFIPIERENISNLMNERKIIRASREEYEGNSNVKLPPLLFAGVLLEGGIVSYETNVFTGGAGVRYFGADASAQYREDRVSIYLRAVSTSNGKILKTVYTTKSILSQEVSVGFFRYVKFKRLLEAETGYTQNEPTEIAITEAVEKAVHSLIIEGILENLWSLDKPEEISSEQIQDYRKEKEENFDVDYMGRKYESNFRSKFYMSILGTEQSYIGDYSTSSFRPGVSFNAGLSLSKSFFMEANFGMQQLYIKNLIQSNEYYSDINLLFLANPIGKFSPYLSFGGGSYYDFDYNIGASEKIYIPYLTYGAGLEYLLSDKIALTGKVFLNQMISDYYDGSQAGQFNDFVWGLKLGFTFYIGK
ncbi:MAG TPA: CsgG/HfaB family protein [Draconibacterium sp.]|nr:CsgG/HfaB family protein [Draconibacterium sp.]